MAAYMGRVPCVLMSVCGLEDPGMIYEANKHPVWKSIWESDMSGLWENNNPFQSEDSDSHFCLLITLSTFHQNSTST